MAAMRKLLLWRTKTPIMPRWDLEISYEDGTTARRTKVTVAEAVEIVRKALAHRVTAQKQFKRRRRRSGKVGKLSPKGA